MQENEILDHNLLIIEVIIGIILGITIALESVNLCFTRVEANLAYNLIDTLTSLKHELS